MSSDTKHKQKKTKNGRRKLATDRSVLRDVATAVALVICALHGDNGGILAILGGDGVLKLRDKR